MKKYSLKMPALFLVIVALFFGVFFLIAKIKTGNNTTTINSAQKEPIAENNSPLQPENIANNSEMAPSAETPASQNSENASNSNISFAVIGDTKSFRAGDPNGNLEKAVASLGKQNFNFAFVMGDLVQSCDGGSSCEQKYADWKNVMAPILSKTYEIMGNHDRTGREKADAVWQKEFNLPTNGPDDFSELTYSFDAGDSHFVVLNSEKPKQGIVNDVQRNWLENDLSANTKGSTFVFFHEPAFQMSQDSKDALDAHPAERDQLWNVLKKHKVNAVFYGHLHMTARKVQDGINQFVVGDTASTADDTPQPGLTDWGLTGHHYSIVSVNNDNIDIKTYSLDGNLENDYSFSK